MMDTGFFKWVWRFNALILACGLSLLLVVVAWEMTSTWRKQMFPTQTRNVIAAPPADVAADPAREVDETANLANTPLPAARGIYALPLRVEQTYENRGISKSSFGNTVNILIADTETQSTTWLFPQNVRLIPQIEPLYLPRTGAANRFLGHLMLVIDTDTNADGSLSRRDTGTVYFVPPNWREPIVLTTDILSLSKVSVMSAMQVDVILRAASGASLARFDLGTGKAVMSLQLFPDP